MLYNNFLEVADEGEEESAGHRHQPDIDVVITTTMVHTLDGKSDHVAHIRRISGGGG